MKRLLLPALAVVFSFQATHAQETEKYGLFDHLGIGVSIGTDGLGFDLAAPITDWAAVRTGMSFNSFIKYTEKDVEIKNPDKTVVDKIDIVRKFNSDDFKLLFDLYPFKSSSFHLTAGAFIGSKKAYRMYTTEPIVKHQEDYGSAYIELGGHKFSSRKDGKAEANVEVKSFRPYLGIGFGRAVPKKSRVTVTCDFGVKFWGKPAVYGWERTPGTTMNDPDWVRYTKLEKEDIDNERGRDFYEDIEKISVYPVINIRLCGRIF